MRSEAKMVSVVRIKLLACAAVALSVAAAVRSASLSDGDGKNRILQGQKLSEKEHDDGENFDYDHEAFLGSEDAREFDELDPEESKRRLSVIVDKIDSDSDGFVTLDEMKSWIRMTQDRYAVEDVERQWTQHNEGGKSEIGWEEYRKIVYGFMDEQGEDSGGEDGEDSYKTMENRDFRRWEAADEDGNGLLTKIEFKHFLHPEEAEHMRGIVIKETMEDIDKDGDGRLSLEEYIGDMYHPDDEGQEPDWVQRERETFKEARDTDGDGYLSGEEVEKWVMPPDFDHVQSESQHLMTESDEDGDGKLTKQEILEKFDLFVGSQATDFGEALTRHEEF